MIKHVVMFTINPEAGLDKKSTQLKVKEKLESLRGKIPGMTSLQAGINQNPSADAFDVCLITEHLTWQDLQNYQDHPLHQAVSSYIGSVKKGRAVAAFAF